VKTRLGTPLVATSFVLFHLSCASVFFIELTWRAPWLFAASYLLRKLGVTLGFHRLFAHRSFKVSRALQLLIGVIATSSFQRGPLWWASSHRRHHKYADTDGDPHAPKDGLFHAQIGWVLQSRAVGLDDVKDLAGLPELVWLERLYVLPPLGLAAVLTAAFGAEGLVVGFIVPTVLIWHVAGLVNSAAHLVGTRAYETRDQSRNVWWLALPTLGESWHNNHHRYPSAAPAGHRVWQLDPTWWVLRALELSRLAHDVRRPAGGHEGALPPLA
jgi:stearoyl-CoA desaturase (Delta-9 desaturase)